MRVLQALSMSITVSNRQWLGENNNRMKRRRSQANVESDQAMITAISRVLN
ncbi:MAG: hypothetical protein PHR51_02440 [Patescibacteria group bacterium]|nr:hypothetical protein [Patescibacteria group bacterium]